MANFDEFFAELNGDPIEGYLHTGERINIPLISHIVDNLYVGGHDRTVNLGDYFSHVFSLYAWGGEYATHEDTVHDTITMYDSPDEDPAKVHRFVSDIIEALDAGGNVLVHCQAGINRSNLTAVLVLREWKGMTSQEAIDLLSEKRDPLILANRGFRKYLLDLDDPQPVVDYPGDGRG